MSERGYIKASRYDLKSQFHNSRVFHRELVARPWRALGFAIGMSILGSTAGFNLIDAPHGIATPGWVALGRIGAVGWVLLPALCRAWLAASTV